MASPEKEGLTREEDDSLRRLAWFAQHVGVSSWARARIEELRSRDRRTEIRPPRQELIAACTADILEGQDVPKAMTGARMDPLAAYVQPAGAPAVEGGGHSVAGLALAAAAAEGTLRTLELPGTRRAKRRHPWSLRKTAKGS